MGVTETLQEHRRVQQAREALAGRDAWVVGGTVRDLLVERGLLDLDLAVDGDPGEAARALGRAANGAAHRL